MPSNPAVAVAGAPRKVLFFAIAAPGVDPASIDIDPEVQVLGWKFGEMDKGDLIDVIAQVDKHLKALEKWCETARSTLKQTLPLPEVAGTETVTAGRLFEAHYIKSQRNALDQEAVKKEMGDDWWGKHLKVTDVFTLRIVPVVQTPGAAAATVATPA